MTTQKLPPYMPLHAAVIPSSNVAIAEIDLDHLLMRVEHFVKEHLTLKMLDVSEEAGSHTLWYVFGDAKRHIFTVLRVPLGKATEYPTITHIVPAAQKYEDKVYEFFGLQPSGRKLPRPLVLHENWPYDLYPLRKNFHYNHRPKVAARLYEFKKIGGEGIYEIPVGPIHAGIIEPGHFRFSVAGEEIVNLEPRLGYTHKGSEKLFEQLGLSDKVRLAEKISGDTSFSHSLAFCQAVEMLAGIQVSDRVAQGRVLLSELERVANHFGDIGAIMLDAGFNFGGNQGSRLREAIMRINERLTGSRFLRGANTIGGLNLSLTQIESDDFRVEMRKIKHDFKEVISIAENTVTVLNRLKGTGVLSSEAVHHFGVVGVPARATGQTIDARCDYPYAAYETFFKRTTPVEASGDVYARFRVRIQEALQSFTIVDEILQAGFSIETSPATEKVVLRNNTVGIGCTEGWRGEVLYLVCTDQAGNINRVAVRDPSFINWQAVSEAAFGEMVPDFPLINKSFNLSYSGNDL